MFIKSNRLWYLNSEEKNDCSLLFIYWEGFRLKMVIAKMDLINGFKLGELRNWNLDRPKKNLKKR